MSIRNIGVACSALVLLAACAEPPRSARVARLDPAPRAVWITDVEIGRAHV